MQIIILSIIYRDDYIPLLPQDMYCVVAPKREFTEEEFWRTLYDMENNFEIALTKKGKLIKTDDVGIFTGVFSASPRGDFGFVVTSKGDFFIPPKFMLYRCLDS